MSNVRIVMTGHGRGEVFVDGRKVDAVKRITLSAEVGATNEVTITVIPETVEFEGVADVTTIEDEVRNYRRGNVAA